ncbi:MAG: hypothetical protein IKW76_06730 [Clostridia bacterium]|nr:hypothetical protein [Clostridia bacterium]
MKNASSSVTTGGGSVNGSNSAPSVFSDSTIFSLAAIILSVVTYQYGLPFGVYSGRAVLLARRLCSSSCHSASGCTPSGRRGSISRLEQ